jgi:hypothetical protein
MRAAGAETRFVSDSPSIEVAFSCPTGSAKTRPCWGPFCGPRSVTIEGGPRTVELRTPDPAEPFHADFVYHPEVRRRCITLDEDRLLAGAESQARSRTRAATSVRLTAYGVTGLADIHLPYVRTHLSPSRQRESCPFRPRRSSAPEQNSPRAGPAFHEASHPNAPAPGDGRLGELHQYACPVTTGR